MAAAVGAAVVVAGVAGAGASTGVETGEVVTGVTTSRAVTDPLIAFFWFLDDVVFGGRAGRPAGYRLRINGNC